METELSKFVVVLSPKKKNGEPECIRFNSDDIFNEQMPKMIKMFFGDGLKRYTEVHEEKTEIVRTSKDYWFVISQV
jgi:hypothetical protein